VQRATTGGCGGEVKEERLTITDKVRSRWSKFTTSWCIIADFGDFCVKRGTGGVGE
jgi:hypothetical protein